MTFFEIGHVVNDSDLDSPCQRHFSPLPVPATKAMSQFIPVKTTHTEFWQDDYQEQHVWKKFYLDIAVIESTVRSDERRENARETVEFMRIHTGNPRKYA